MQTKPFKELFPFFLALATLLPLHFPVFYTGHQACGYPGFQLHNCDSDFPVLDIPPLSYRVLELNFSAHTLKVARQDLLIDTCLPAPYTTTLIPGLFDFAPDSSDENVTLFFDCTSNQNQWKSLTNQFSCNVVGVETINLFRRGDASSGPGQGITCKNNISVPVNQAAALELENSMSMDVLQEALAGGFVVRWPANVAYCEECTTFGGMCGFNSNSSYFICYMGSQWSVQFSPPPAQGPRYPPGRTISNGREQSPSFYIVVAVSTTGLVIFSVIICCYYLKRGSRRPGLDKENIEKFLLQHGSLAPKRYKYSEIKKITKSFKAKLGQGGFGSVYHGMLPNDSPVAVKVLISNDSNGEEFMNEVVSISRTSHVNIINLLGFCYDRNKRALVYEFMPNKSLDKFISNNADSQLGCETLYKIAVGVAKGLEYLHTGWNTRIVHFDIKPQNILLDEDFCPKISDFGLAKLCKKQQSILSMLGARGTIGYIAPEVFSRNYGGVSHKSDVYSYGMMVLEMAGARKLVEPEAAQSSENYFPDRIYEHVVLNITKNSNDFIIEEEEEMGRKMFLVGFCVFRQIHQTDHQCLRLWKC
ncbi:LEAF RUST 10 DISEASE-RESISTANCE LOCUS RECEPTOR-LIKE PROTEIN KINASE-like 2.1 [Sesamum alatum]|uniref:non-specific serine/threonine protein kinase n=1 Tax=Sesamum alatum TaxID=300844 RepID=A0AAE2CLN8_9LAMI|nr:LEAF RUST 10 DISEASE-RESISTANCE LOCUS RECEPTOR-LIKE PROTEIN KINASE-like 2.1 [Sesamum alatum]